MFSLLLIVFIGVPIAEIALFIEVGGEIGLLPTLLACVVTAALGAWLARTQGASVLRQVQSRIWRGEVPAAELVDAVMIMVAGVVLMTPGFVTDAVGLLLLFPPTRALARGLVLRRIADRVARRGASGWRGEHPWGDEPPWRAPRPPPWDEAADRQRQPSVELLPPERAPRPPRPHRPDVIDVPDDER